MTVDAELLQAFRDARPVWIPDSTELLPDRPRRDVARALRQLVADGWVEEWPDSPDGPAHILSSRATSKFRLELHDEGGLQRSRWVREGKGPSPTVAGLHGPHEGGEYIDDAPDPGWPAVVDRVIFADTVAQALAKDPAQWKLWREAAELLVTGGSVPCWTRGHEPPRGEPCPVCAGDGPPPAPARTRPDGMVVFQGAGAVCLGCLRSSVDSVLPTPRPIPEPKRKAAPAKKRKTVDACYELAAAAPAGGDTLRGGIG